jgi:hypothetical protein
MKPYMLIIGIFVVIGKTVTNAVPLANSFMLLTISGRNGVLDDTKTAGQGFGSGIVVKVTVEGDSAALHYIIGPGGRNLSCITPPAIFGEDFDGEFGRFLILLLRPGAGYGFIIGHNDKCTSLLNDIGEFGRIGNIPEYIPFSPPGILALPVF